MDWGGLIAIVLGLAGLGGLVFTALRFQRDTTSATVTQQSSILHDMAGLNDEMRTAVGDLRSERDELRGQVAQLREQVDRLTHELRRFSATAGDV